MPERKDVAGKDDERQVRGRQGSATQSRSERNRKPARKGRAGETRTVPKMGKHDAPRDGPSGDGLH